MPNLLKRFIREETGATAIEFSLLASLIAMVIVGLLGDVGTTLKNTFTTIANRLPD